MHRSKCQCPPCAVHLGRRDVRVGKTSRTQHHLDHRATASTFGAGTSLNAIDDYTIEWTFADPFAKGYLTNVGPLLSEPGACPQGQASQLRQHGELFRPTETIRRRIYELSVRRLVVTATARMTSSSSAANPYYWKVDENGNQLPRSRRSPVQALDLGRSRRPTLAGTRLRPPRAAQTK